MGTATVWLAGRRTRAGGRRANGPGTGKAGRARAGGAGGGSRTWRIDYKLVYRLDTEERLGLERRRTKRRKSAAFREMRPLVSRPDERWAMDFVHDVLADGRTIVVDVSSRECGALAPRTSFRAEDVCRILSEVGERRGKLPEGITVDDGREFASKALDHSACWNRVRLDFNRPGKLMDNGHIEAFNGSLRHECLSQPWFLDLDEASAILSRWREDYN